MSLTGTGVCLIDGDKVTLNTITSLPKDFNDIHDRIDSVIERVKFYIPEHTQLVCIEEAFFHVKNRKSAMNILALGYMVRREMIRAGYRLIDVAAMQLKKYATGKSKAQKDQIMMWVLKRWGIETQDNNQADACVLAHLAKAYIQDENFEIITPPLITPQAQVIAAIRAKQEGIK